MDTSLLISTYIVFAYIAVGLVLAVIRWYHVCPCGENDPDFYYPARKVLCFAYLCNLFALPYVIHPSSPDAGLAVGLIPLLLFPVVEALMFEKYFSLGHKYFKSIHCHVFAILPYAAIVALAVFSLIGGNTLSEHVVLVKTLVFLCALLPIVWLFTLLRGLVIRMKAMVDSKEDEKILLFARKTLWACIIVDLFLAMPLFYCNTWVITFLYIVLNVADVWLLVLALKPYFEKVLKIPSLPQFDMSDWLGNKAYCEKGVTLESLATEFCTNSKYLSKYIHYTYGMEFRNWVSSLRLQEAKNLILSKEQHNLTEVAEAVGLSGASSLTKLFQKYEGMTPTEWLNSQS